MVRMRFWTVVALAAVPAVALAAGSGKPGECLSGGRKLANKGLHKEAIAAFQACLQATPDDASVESEIAAEAFQVHDLDLAERSARAAVAHAGANPRPKAAALYDLGRIAEERKDVKAAIQAYTDSLAIRSSAVVVQRLRALDPGAAAEREKLSPAPLEGPYERFEEACKEHIAYDSKAAVAAFQKAYELANPKALDKLDEKTQEFASKFSCVCPDTTDSNQVDEPTIGALGKGWDEPRVFLSSCGAAGSYEPHSTFRVGLALKTPKGWYVADTIAYDVPQGQYEKIREIHLARRSGGRELMWTFDVNVGSYSHYREVSSSETELFVIGVGASGEPSEANVTIARSEREWVEGQKDSGDTDVALKVSWNKEGQLVLSGKTDEDGVVGAHTLLFP
jgi:tetratricopeptide (TPR) repeat protein